MSSDPHRYQGAARVISVNIHGDTGVVTIDIRRVVRVGRVIAADGLWDRIPESKMR